MRMRSLNLSWLCPTLNQRECSSVATQPSGIDSLRDVVDGYKSLRCYISPLNGLDNQMFLLWNMTQGGKTDMKRDELVGYVMTRQSSVLQTPRKPLSHELQCHP